MQVLAEKMKQRLNIGKKQFVPTNIDRDIVLMEAADDFAQHLRKYESAVRGYEAASFDYITATGRLLNESAIKHEYVNNDGQLGRIETGQTTQFSHLYKKNVRRSVFDRMPDQFSDRFRAEVLLPIQLWNQAYVVAKERFTNLERQRLRVDAYRRKVESRVHRAEKLEQRAEHKRASTGMTPTAGAAAANANNGPFAPTTAGATTTYPAGDAATTAYPTTTTSTYAPTVVGSGGSPSVYGGTQGGETLSPRFSQRASTMRTLSDEESSSSDEEMTAAEKRAAKMEGRAEYERSRTHKPLQKAMLLLSDFEEDELNCYERLNWLVYDGSRLKAYLTDTMLYMEATVLNRKLPEGLLTDFPTRVGERREIRNVGAVPSSGVTLQDGSRYGLQPATPAGAVAIPRSPRYSGQQQGAFSEQPAAFNGQQGAYNGQQGVGGGLVGARNMSPLRANRISPERRMVGQQDLPYQQQQLGTVQQLPTGHVAKAVQAQAQRAEAERYHDTVRQERDQAAAI